MKDNYIKTGKFTADGVTFHSVGTNVRIDKKHYCSATDETLKALGLFENLQVLISQSDYEVAMEGHEEDENPPFSSGFEEIDGETYWVTYRIVPDVN